MYVLKVYSRVLKKYILLYAYSKICIFFFLVKNYF